MAKEDLYNNRKNINEVLEASTNIHSRLFNHKHFIDGEINYFINKTEKNDCKDIDQLLKQIHDQHQAKQSHINERKELMSLDKLNEFQKKAEQLLKKSNDILQLDLVNEEKRKSRFDEFTKSQNVKGENIRLQNEAQLEEVDKYYERKKIEAAKYYHELESKWEI